MAVKLTYEKINSEFTNKGWKLISKEYLGSQKNLIAICPNKHETTITWNNFQRGQGCKYCSGNIKYTYEYIKKTFEENNCVLLSKHYINNNEPLDYKCKCGNISKVAFCEFIKGRRCQKCKSATLSQKNKISDEELISFCKKNECKFIESKLIKKRTRIKYICSCGKESETYWTNFRRFPNCWECGKKKKMGSNCHLWNPDREQVARNKLFQKRCYNILSRTLKETDQIKLNKMHKILGYTPTDLQNHILQHPDFKNNWIEWHIDHYFPVKAFMEYNINDLKLINCLKNLRPMEGKENLSKGSKYDKKEFELWLDEIGYKNFDLNKIIKDFKSFFKTLNDERLAAEIINPINYVDRRELKLRLKNLISNKKIPVFILPFEWCTKNEHCKNRLRSISGQFNERVFARKCEVKEITTQVHSQFCDKYHMQGRNKLAFKAWGLFLNDKLIGSMSLGRHPRNNNDILLDRLCFHPEIQVIGGANKLFNKCKKWAASNNINKIVSFSDNRWSLGKVYENMGFILEKELEQDYFYIKSGDPFTMITKQSQKKSNTNCPKDKTEHEWAKMNGLTRVWDCGKKRWVFILN